MLNNLCEICGRNRATQFIKHDGETYQVCPICAEKYNSYQNPFFDDPFFGLNDFMYDYFDDMIPAKVRQPQSQHRVCPNCGTTEEDAKNYKFGCSQCYEIFNDIAQKAVSELGGQQYNGKFADSIPQNKKVMLSQMTQKDIPLLEKFMKAAAEKGDYKKADIIKTKIAQLKGEK